MFLHRVPLENIWRPDILLYNNADKQYSSQMTSTNAIVTNDGNITWFSSAIFKSSCSINVEYFPFDEQTCTLKFASWTYDGLKLDLISTSNTTDLSNYVANGEWDLVVASVKRNVVFYSCCEEPYPDVTYHFVLRRRPLFYGRFIFIQYCASFNTISVFNLILPCVLITGIALMSFYMPSDSGEKVKYLHSFINHGKFYKVKHCLYCQCIDWFKFSISWLRLLSPAKRMVLKLNVVMSL